MNNALQQWIEAATSDTIQAAHKLDGSTSSTLYRLQMTGRELVVRIFDNAEWLAEEPDLARHEAAALNKVQSLPVAAPACIAFDETGAACGGLPAIIMTMLPGRNELQPVDLDDWLRQQAETLAQIHAVPIDDFAWEYFPWGALQGQSVPVWSATPANWQRAIAMAEGPESTYRDCFLHRDYHPMNVLWHNDKLSGVVDWPNACRGPAMVDIAHCRTNLVSMYGIEVADRFLDFYQQRAGSAFTYDPYWEIIGMVAELAYPVETYLPWATFGLTGITPQLMQQRLDTYLASVLARC